MGNKAVRGYFRYKSSEFLTATRIPTTSSIISRLSKLTPENYWRFIPKRLFGMHLHRAQRILRNGEQPFIMSTVRPNLMAHLFFQEQVPNAEHEHQRVLLSFVPNKTNPFLGFLFSYLFVVKA